MVDLGADEELVGEVMLLVMLITIRQDRLMEKLVVDCPANCKDMCSELHNAEP